SYGHHGAGRVGHCAAAQGISAVREASLRVASRHGPAARDLCLTNRQLAKHWRLLKRSVIDHNEVFARLQRTRAARKATTQISEIHFPVANATGRYSICKR